jgi:hypothetical protein
MPQKVQPFGVFQSNLEGEYVIRLQVSARLGLQERADAVSNDPSFIWSSAMKLKRHANIRQIC